MGVSLWWNVSLRCNLRVADPYSYAAVLQPRYGCAAGRIFTCCLWWYVGSYGSDVAHAHVFHRHVVTHYGHVASSTDDAWADVLPESVRGLGGTSIGGLATTPPGLGSHAMGATWGLMVIFGICGS